MDEVDTICLTIRGKVCLLGRSTFQVKAFFFGLFYVYLFFFFNFFPVTAFLFQESLKQCFLYVIDQLKLWFQLTLCLITPELTDLLPLCTKCL